MPTSEKNDRMPQTVICMKWGTRYPAGYVNRLFNMVKRNTNRPLRFICFTDDPADIWPEVELRPLPDIELPEDMTRLPWRKVSLWQQRLEGIEGKVLFLDLDVLVTGSIDDFFDFSPSSSFCVIKNWTTERRGSASNRFVGNTSCYRFEIGAHAYLYDKLQKNPHFFLGKYRNSQTYISNEISEITFWPESWCVSFKHSLLPSWPKRLFIPASLPREARIVAFTGKPDIHDVMEGRWPEPNPLKRPFKQLVKPDWVEGHWS
jgi:hypothetical protein